MTSETHWQVQEDLQRECDTWQKRAQALEVPKGEGTGGTPDGDKVGEITRNCGDLLI